MDKIERAQIRLLLEHLGAERRAKTTARNKAMHAERSANGTLGTGATVKAAVRIAEELATAYVTELVAAVSDVAKDIEAFNMMVTDVTIMFQDLQPSIDEAVRLATTGGSGGQRFDSVSKEAGRLLRELQARTLRLLEIHRFSFIKTSPNDRNELLPRLGKTAPPAAKNKGGKPLAKHWDDMWAAIAVSLWTGDLKPESQADVKRAMQAWFDDQEIDVGNTPVVERARALWRKMEASR